MIIINKDAKPRDTVYYISCCAFGALKRHGSVDLKRLYEIVKNSYDLIDLNYTSFQLSVNFLFLVNKIELDREKIRCI